jgi:anti-sigma B factor antagonist
MNDPSPIRTRVITFDRTLDVANAPDLRDALAATAGAAAAHVVLDLRGVDFADSTGLSVLLNAARRNTASGRHLVVVCGPGPVMRLLELTALTQTLNVVATVDDAHGLIGRAAAGPFRSHPVG